MRWLTPVLLTLVVAIQWPLWFGKGSWFRVWQVEKQFTEQQTIDQNKIARNRALAAEVEDLKTGNTAVEERARYELGMVRNGEVFFQILDTSGTPQTTASAGITTLTAPEETKQ